MSFDCKELDRKYALMGIVAPELLHGSWGCIYHQLVGVIKGVTHGGSAFFLFLRFLVCVWRSVHVLTPNYINDVNIGRRVA